MEPRILEAYMKALRMESFLALLLVAIGCVSSPEEASHATERETPAIQPNTLSKEERADGWRLLFDLSLIHI